MRMHALKLLTSTIQHTPPRPLPHPIRLLSTSRRVERESLESSRLKRLGQKAGTLLLLTATGVVAVSAFDDFLIYQQCSRKAMLKAAGDERLKRTLGEPIVQGAWYEATLATANKGQFASCSFPIHGSQGNANLRLRAVCSEDSRKWRNIYKIFSAANWEVLVLEAYVSVTDGENAQVERINLMDTNDTPKAGDFVRVECSPCQVKAADIAKEKNHPPVGRVNKVSMD